MLCMGQHGALGGGAAQLEVTLYFHMLLFADQANTLLRCTKRAPRRAVRQKRRPSSALPRRWRMSARSWTSRCCSCWLCGIAEVHPLPGLCLQSVYASDSG